VKSLQHEDYLQEIWLKKILSLNSSSYNWKTSHKNPKTISLLSQRSLFLSKSFIEGEQGRFISDRAKRIAFLSNEEKKENGKSLIKINSSFWALIQIEKPLGQNTSYINWLSLIFAITKNFNLLKLCLCKNSKKGSLRVWREETSSHIVHLHSKHVFIQWKSHY